MPRPSRASGKTPSITYVSNGVAGNPVIAFSDGTSWRRVDGLSAISAT